MAGRQRIVHTKMTHGEETRAARIARSEKLAELEAFDSLGRILGMIKGPQKRGRKCKTVVEFPDLDLVAKRIVCKSI